MCGWHKQGVDVSPHLQVNLGFQIPEYLDCSMSASSPDRGSAPSYMGDILLLENKWGCWFGQLLLPDAHRVFKYETMVCLFNKCVRCFLPVYYRQGRQHHIVVPVPKGHPTCTAQPDILALVLIVVLIHCSKKILCNQLFLFF